MLWKNAGRCRVGERWNDQRIETLVAAMLRAGVLIAAVVGLIGGAVYLLHHGHDAPRYHVFTGEPAEYRSVTDIVTDALEGRGRGLIQLGVLLLVATPVARSALRLRLPEAAGPALCRRDAVRAGGALVQPFHVSGSNAS